MDFEYCASTKVFIGADINGFAQIINAPITVKILCALHPVTIHTGIDTGRIRLQAEISGVIHKPRIVGDGIDRGGKSADNVRRGAAVGKCICTHSYVQIRINSASVIAPYYGVFNCRGTTVLRVTEATSISYSYVAGDRTVLNFKTPITFDSTTMTRRMIINN